MHFRRMGKFRKPPDCQPDDFLFIGLFLCVNKQRDHRQTDGWVGVLDSVYLEVTVKSGCMRHNFPSDLLSSGNFCV